MDRNIVDKREILEMVKQKRLTSEEALRLLRNNMPIDTGEEMREEHPETLMYKGSWAEAGLAGDVKAGVPQGNILIFDTDCSLFEAFKEYIGRSGDSKVSVVKPGKGFANDGEGLYEINPQNPEEYRLLLKSMEEENRYPEAIIHFWSTEGCEDSEMLEDVLSKSIYSLFNLFQVLMDSKAKTNVSVVYAYTVHEDDTRPQYAAAGAFIRTARLENPKFMCKVVVLSQEGLNYQTLPGILMDELSVSAQDDIEVSWKQCTRYVKRLKEFGEIGAANLKIRQEGVYLITGGLGGLGYLFASYLASKAAVKLVLTGRSELDEEKTAKMRKLSELGAKAVYIKADVTSRESIDALVSQMRTEFGNVCGVIHSAGVYRNGFIIKKSREDFAEVFAPKIYGTLYIDEALKDDDLDFFVLFSSISAVSGKVGQSDYSFANSYLDYFALDRERKVQAGVRKGRTVSLNWPFWEKEGMAREITQEERRMYAEKAGIEGLPTEEGVKVFETVVLNGESHQCIVFYGYKNKISNYLDSVMSNTDKRTDAQTDSTDMNILYQKTQEFLKEMISNEIGTPAANIDPGVSFEEFGIDSIIVNHFNAEMEKRIPSVSKTVLFEYPNINELASHMVKIHEQELVRMFGMDKKPAKSEVQVKKLLKSATAPVQKNAPKHEDILPKTEKDRTQNLLEDDIAVIGISGRYPKANSLDEFWENLKLAKDCVTEVPSDRWDHSEYFDPNHERVKPGKTYCKWGGFIDDIDKFDPLFFNISPREAELMDPQERIFLQIVWEAIEDAGYTRELLREVTNGEKSANVGVFVGTTTYQYEMLGIEEWKNGNMVTPISHPWSIANRISYTCNFNGPSIPLDTACSSSLSAFHYACESLRKGECGIAVAGGVHMYLHPYKYVSMAQMGMFSPTGRCRAFSNDADGFIPAEGAGALILKPLRKAVADGDHIYAVVKGTAVNHGGKTNGYTVPNPNAQASLISDTIRKSGIDPKYISYIETHGTGTKLGDPVEVTGMTKAFREYNKDRQYCAIGSVKSNIGHAEAAAGIAGLTKIILQMKNKQLVPSIHCDELNQNIDFQKTPFYVQRELTEWKRPSVFENGVTKEYPRYAGISAFGAGGSNAHAILMEYDEELLRDISDQIPQIIVLSAKNEERLHEYASKLVNFLEKKTVELKLPSIINVVTDETAKEIKALKLIEDSDIEDYTGNLKELEKFQVVLLVDVFRRMGIFKVSGEKYLKDELKEKLKIIPLYDRLFDALLDMLERYGYIAAHGDAFETTDLIDSKEVLSIFKNVEKEKQDFDIKHPSIHAYTKLLTTCIKSYPDVLTGKKNHVDVMFPNGSVELVEGIYKGNKLIDYFNKLVSVSVKQYVKQRLAKDPGAVISILEVGSGTGGTSKFAMEELKEYSSSIKYYYTDISKGLVQYGKRVYGKYGFAEFKVLDIEKSPETQDFKPNSIDIVFATNVLHATQNIRRTLANTGNVLKPNGIIVINEFTVLGDFSTLTYGLTKGWWLFDDEESRIKWAPLLSTEGWKACLEKNGFVKTGELSFIGNYSGQSVQNVIFAEFAGEASGKERVINVSLKDLAYTLKVGREHLDERLAVLVSNPEDLVFKMKAYLKKQSNIQDMFTGNVKSDKSRTELLVKGKAGKEFLNILFNDKEYAYLAQLWVAGVEIDWKLMYTDGEKNRRLSLPTYPFAKNSYWIETVGKVALPAAVNAHSRALHPVVDFNISTLYDCRFVKTFTGSEFYIEDHKNVLPGVLYLEMVRAAGQIACGDRSPEKIKNFVWINPIGLEGSPKDVYTEFYPSKEGIVFEISTISGDGLRTINASGKIGPSEEGIQASELIDIKAIISRCGVNRARDYYDRMTALGNVAGPRFRGLVEFYCNEDEALSRLDVLPEFKTGIGEYTLHPTLTDGAFQTLNAFAWSVLKGCDPIFVPFAMDEMEIYKGSFTAAYGYVRMQEHLDKSNADTLTCDLSILDEKGQTVVKIKGLTFRQIPKAYMDMLTAKQTEYTGICYKSLWEAAEIMWEGCNPAFDGTLIFDVSEGLSSSLQCLEPSSKITLVKPGAAFRKAGETVYEINPSNEADYEELFEDLDKEGSIPQNIVFAWSQGGFTYEKEEIGRQLNAGLYPVFNTCKSLKRRESKGKTSILYAYSCKKASISPAFAALSSFARSLWLEDSNMVMRTLGIDIGLKDWEDYKSSMLPGILRKELGVLGDYEVRYENGRRLIRNMKTFDMDSEATYSQSIKDGGVYVITGGTGGLGLVFAEQLSRKYKARLVLCGRSEPGAEIRSKINSFEHYGSKIVFVKADISTEDGARALVASTKAEFGRIDGIIHSAGVVRDSLLGRKTREELDAVLKAKVYGTIHLDAALREAKPDFFVMFSSTSSVLGNIGQCDYSFANGFMDYYAEMLECEGIYRKTLAINWGPWRHGGMKPGEQNEKFLLDVLGIKAMESEVGFGIFEKGLSLPMHGFVGLEGDSVKVQRIPAFSGKLGQEVKAEPKKAEEKRDSSVVLNNFKNDMTALVSSILKIPAGEIYGDDDLSGYGFDSVSFTELSKLMNEKFRLEVSPARFFGYSTLNKTVTGIYEENGEILNAYYNASRGEAECPSHGEETRKPAAPTPKVCRDVRAAAFRDRQEQTSSVPANDPVAIIGMSGMMPQSADLDEFWKNLESEKTLITEIPKDRWEWEESCGDSGKEKLSPNVKWGGFMKEIDKFDASFFSIPPVEAELMDPQERLVLQTAWNAVEDAGYKMSELSGTDTGVFIGVSNTDYKELLIKKGIPEVMPSQSFVANRISYTFNLRGPSEPVDSACSSALVAIHRAVKAIQTEECTMVLAGAVNVIASPNLYILDDKLGLLSSDGRCKSYDKNADGYVRGEGVGVLLLKSLKQAVADGDNIYAVIKVTGVQHGGRGTAINTPNADAQADIIYNVIDKSGIDPATISYIDGHGTGTLLGDAAEIEGLKKAFKKLYKKWNKPETVKPHIGIGSVKTNVGHLEPAAGIAGVFKVVLAMRNKKLPASLGFGELNPYVKLYGSPFYITDKASEWMPVLGQNNKSLPRRAGVSAFGAGGTNAHIIIEEYQVTTSHVPKSGIPRLIVLSAQNSSRLKEYAQKLAEYLKNTVNRSISSEDSRGELLSCLNTKLVSILSGILGVTAGEIDAETDLKECGLDPVGFSELAKRINDKLNLQLSSAILVQYNTLASMANYIFSEHREDVRSALTKERKADALTGEGIGMADIEYTLQMGREEMAERLAIIASSMAELQEKLLLYCSEAGDAKNIFTGNSKVRKEDTMLLFEEEDGKEYINNLIKKRKLAQVAKLWVKGISINWGILDHEPAARRIPLPPYPFARERYWVPEKSHDWKAVDSVKTKNKQRAEQAEKALPEGADDTLMALLRKVENGELSAQQALEKDKRKL